MPGYAPAYSVPHCTTPHGKGFHTIPVWKAAAVQLVAIDADGRADRLGEARHRACAESLTPGEEKLATTPHEGAPAAEMPSVDGSNQAASARFADMALMTRAESP